MTGRINAFWSTPCRFEKLAELWVSGISTRAIGDRLGCTKNAVIGQAHRQGLPKRASAIKRDAVPTQMLLEKRQMGWSNTRIGLHFGMNRKLVGRRLWRCEPAPSMSIVGSTLPPLPSQMGGA